MGQNGGNGGPNLWDFNASGALTLPQGSQISETANTSVNITANANTWAFGVNGTLTLPGNTFAVNYANGTQVPVGVTQDITSNGAMSIYEKETFENTAKFLIEEYDYIFYISPVGVAIEDNGVRETNAEYRDKIDQTIRKTLWIYNHRIKNLIELSGSVEERVEKVISTIFP